MHQSIDAGTFSISHHDEKTFFFFSENYKYFIYVEEFECISIFSSLFESFVNKEKLKFSVLNKKPE